MKKKKLFGNNIEVSCSYCEHSVIQGGCQFCTIGKSIKNGRCRKFVYNPIMRIPKKAVVLKKYSAEDFVI